MRSPVGAAGTGTEVWQGMGSGQTALALPDPRVSDTPAQHAWERQPPAWVKPRRKRPAPQCVSADCVAAWDCLDGAVGPGTSHKVSLLTSGEELALPNSGAFRRDTLRGPRSTSSREKFFAMDVLSGKPSVAECASTGSCAQLKLFRCRAQRFWALLHTVLL